MKRSKYRAVRTSCGLHEHPSKKEASRCIELRFMEKHGLIKELRFQPEFDLGGGVKYRADFRYFERQLQGVWVEIIEDVKGYLSAIYKLKRKMMKNVLGVEIRET